MNGISQRRAVGLAGILVGAFLFIVTGCNDERPVSPTGGNGASYKATVDSMWEDQLVTELESVRDTIARRMLSRGINPDELEAAMLRHDSKRLLALMGWSAATDAAFMKKAASIGEAIRGKYPMIDSAVIANGSCTTCSDPAAIVAFHDKYYVRLNDIGIGLYSRTALPCSGNKIAYIATLIGCSAIAETPFFLFCVIGAWCSYCPESC